MRLWVLVPIGLVNQRESRRRGGSRKPTRDDAAARHAHRLHCSATGPRTRFSWAGRDHRRHRLGRLFALADGAGIRPQRAGRWRRACRVDCGCREGDIRLTMSHRCGVLAIRPVGITCRRPLAFARSGIQNRHHFLPAASSDSALLQGSLISSRCDFMQASMRPPPCFTPAQSFLTSAMQDLAVVATVVTTA